MSGTLASLKIMLGLDTSGMASGASQAKGMMQNLSRASNVVTGMVGAGVGSFVYSSMEKFKAFDDQMREVWSIIPNASKESIDKMGDQVKKLAVDMHSTTEDIGAGLYDALSSGIPQDNVFSFMETAAKTARAGVAETAPTVKVLAAVTNAYRLTSEETTVAADQMFKAVQLGVTTIPELSASLAQVTPLAAAAGVGFDEVLASVTAMTLQGTPTAESITQIRSAMVALQKGTPTLNKVIGDFGYESSQAMFEALGFQGSLEMLRKISDQTGIPLIKLTGRIEGANAVLQLTGDNADAAHKALEGVRDSTGAVDGAFAIMESGVGGKIREMTAMIGNFAIDLGGMLQPVMPLMMAFGPQAGRLLGMGIGAGLGLGLKSLAGVLKRAAPELLQTATDMGIEAGGGLGKGFVKMFTGSIVTSMKSAGTKKLIAGAIAMAVGMGIKSATEGSDNALVSAGGGLAGSLTTIAGAFAVGGPVLATVVAIGEAISGFVHVLDIVNGAQQELTDKVAKVSEQTGQEALANMQKMTKSMQDAQGFERIVGDTLGQKQMLDALVEQGKAIQNAETLSVGEIDTAISTLGQAAIEAAARGNDAIATQLRTQADSLGQMRVLAVESGGVYHKIADATTEGGNAAAAATDAAGNTVVTEVEDARTKMEKAIKSLGTIVGDAWNAVTNSLAKGPKVQSMAQRMKMMRRAIEQNVKGLRRAVRKGDVVAAAEYNQRIIDAQNARQDILGNAKDVMTESGRILGQMAGKNKRIHHRMANDTSKEARRAARIAERQAKKQASAVPDELTSKVPEVATAATNTVTAVQTPLTQAATDASTWGEHLGQNFAAGISSQYDAAVAAADRLAGAVHSRMGFSSPPKKGPLRTIRSWGPHMVVQWLRPIQRSMKDVHKTGDMLGKAITPKHHGGKGGWRTDDRKGQMPQWGGSVMKGARIEGDVHIHIGTLIADDHGLDELDRRMKKRRKMKDRSNRRYNNA